MEEQQLIDPKLTKEGAMVLRALNNRFRQVMIKVIHNKQRTNVTSIYKKLKWEQSIVSQHLRILRQAGFVHTEREGKEIYYSIHYEGFAQVDKLIKEIV